MTILNTISLESDKKIKINLNYFTIVNNSG